MCIKLKAVKSVYRNMLLSLPVADSVKQNGHFFPTNKDTFPIVVVIANILNYTSHQIQIAQYNNFYEHVL